MSDGELDTPMPEEAAPQTAPQVETRLDEDDRL